MARFWLAPQRRCAAAGRREALGFVLAQLGDVPRPEIGSLGRMVFSVVEMDGRWMDKVLVEPT